MKKITIIAMLVVILCGLASCNTSKKQVLYLFCWTDYIDLDLIKQFESEYNCRVILDTYNSNESMHAKMLTSKSAFDIIVPSADFVSILINDDLLEPLDMSLLPNYKNLDPATLSRVEEYDYMTKYALPYFWGTSGIIYNKNYISDEEMANVSWDIFGDPKYNDKGVVTMLDDIREVLGAALIYNGYDCNDSSDEALIKARATLLRWDKNVVQYDSDSFKNEVQDGTIWFGHAYNGDALQVMHENEDIGFALPKEGSTLWVDFMVIPRKSENKELAHKFLNFLLDEEVALQNAEFVQYATPNLAAYTLLGRDERTNLLMYPPEEYLDKCYILKDIKEEILKLDVIWQEIRNN